QRQPKEDRWTHAMPPNPARRARRIRGHGVCPSVFLRLALRGREHDEARQPMRPAVREAAARALPRASIACVDDH
ncbi:hypothetical protein NX847_12645, partial [Burkholderia thailandensis]|nr:hypothetical protein [Burkholderia thailandensis]